MKPKIRARDIMAAMNWTVEVRLTGMRLLRFRLAVATWLIWLAGKVAGVGSVTFKDAIE